MASRSPMAVVCAFALIALAACGGRSMISRGDSDNASVGPPVELCDGLDQDSDGRVDEDFRDADGNYLTNQHCGMCGHACGALPNASDVGCALLRGVPSCVAKSCAKGFGVTLSGGCAVLDDHLCLACRDDGDCGTLASARCVSIAGEPHCVRDCGDGCPNGYVCVGKDHCEPEGGTCSCSKAQPDFTLACASGPDSARCIGSARCVDGVLSDCGLPDERCDGVDNDCDGRVDEGFVDSRAAYSVDLHNCGACGVDCSADSDAGVELACGGDPFAPSCVNACPDTENGIQIGDRLDADRKLKNGCECRVTALEDASGASASDALDANCDGADGNVVASVYVSVGGDDNGPGSPTRPLRSIGAAITLAHATLDSEHPRPDIYVASGVYTESVRLLDGVSLHGGYRSDFLARSPSGFEVVVVAPADTQAFGGAALSAERVGTRASLVEGFTFRGRDALAPGEPAVAVDLREPGLRFTLRDVRVRAGKPGAGVPGIAGAAGAGPTSMATDGAPPRAASEDASHSCISSDTNRVRGGAAGVNVCGAVDASGGDGGSSTCPVYGASEASGQNGSGTANSSGGGGGLGGRDLKGPIEKGVDQDDSCPNAVCCGLADFSVPAGDAVLPAAGRAGQDGKSGGAGHACTDPIGNWSNAGWIGASATSGTSGGAGGGAGGGGAGGGVVMKFIADACEFPDGLGGAGGGGGGGGCGGAGGLAGSSGGPAIGVLIRSASASTFPTLSGISIETHDGGPGGAGGAGGDGGDGGSGGFGGELRDEQRSTPPLAGPLAGERGGKGGDGGAGGGGGGGCGGSSIGIWIHGLGAQPELSSRLQSANQFALGSGAPGGPGGGGAKPAPAGTAGRTLEVFAD